MSLAYREMKLRFEQHQAVSKINKGLAERSDRPAPAAEIDEKYWRPEKFEEIESLHRAFRRI